MNLLAGRAATCLVLPLLLLASCDRAGLGEDDLGRIVIGESVDGVPFGADSALVFRRLGQPTRKNYSFHTDNATFHYERGTLAGLEIHLREDAVHSFYLTLPYVGKTEEGLGLGSTESEALVVLGEPNHVFEGEIPGEPHYSYNNHGLLLLYKDRRLNMIAMTLPLIVGAPSR